MRGIKRFKSIIKLFKGQNLEDALTNENGFVDSVFPPNQDSLFNNLSEIPEEKKKYPKFAKDKKKQMLTQDNYAQRLDRYDWAELNKIKNINRLHVIKDFRNMKDDVIQGELGDNNFLSVLIALVQNDKLNIKNIVDYEAKATDQAFEAIVFINGEPVPVIVDNQFPVLANNKVNKFAFSGVNDYSGNI